MGNKISLVQIIPSKKPFKMKLIEAIENLKKIFNNRKVILNYRRDKLNKFMIKKIITNQDKSKITLVQK